MNQTGKFLSLFCISFFLVAFLDDFPEDENKILVLQNCVLCHSESLVSQQEMKRDEWDTTLLWMENKHKLKFESKETRKKILDYLTSYFGPKTEAEYPFLMGRRPVNPLPF